MQTSHSMLVPVLLLGLCGLCSGAGNESGGAVLERIKTYGDCVIQSSFSFIYPKSMPPKSEAELKALCKSQADGFKCIKERTKGGPGPIRRGLVGYVTGRMKHHKKYCSDTSSQRSREFVAATKCLLERRLTHFRNNDLELLQVFEEVARRNYNDSAAELKRICCSFHTFRRNFLEATGQECAAHKLMVEELADTIVSEQLNLVCDDEEKLSKICPKLEPLQFKRVSNFEPGSRLPFSVLAIYLIATLGEPNDSAVI